MTPTPPSPLPSPADLASTDLAEVERIADALGQVVLGDFDLTVQTTSKHPIVQKLALMVNFTLASVRQTMEQNERVESALKSQMFLMQLIDLQTDLIFTLDTEGRTVLINKAACDFLGVYPEQVMGQRPSDIDHPQKRLAQAVVETARRIASTGKPMLNLEQRVPDRDGKVHWFKSNFVPVMDDQYRVTQVLFVMSDVTELREAAHEMGVMVNDLQQALKFKDQFMAVMSHELRTPLNAILGFTGIALMTGDASSQMQRMLERIDFNARRLVSLINDVLDLSRINAGRIDILWERVTIRELAQAWHDSFLPRATAKGVQLVLDIAPDLPETLETDPDRLTQIANNLLTNATKFTEKGSVTLSLRRLDEARWALTVRDTGIGISEAYQTAIFEEFRQVEAGMQSKYGGAGLGLSIVQKLCVLMGGQIAVQSKLGEGSTFTASLPLSRPALIAPKEA
ncbi:MAG: ATP-binding protein [Anaerolineae bacterium]|nr:ATP-binding protein [Anaerolineae bacterium]